MAANNNLDTLNGLFKEVYAKDIEDLVPDGVKLLSRIPFAKKEASLGNFYHQPVVLGQEHGVTFAASGDDAYALNAPIAGQMKDATVRGNQLVLRSVVGYASAARSAEGGAKAFKQATKFLVGNMLRSITKKLEISMINGQMGYAIIDTATLVSGTTYDLLIKTAEWAPGIWAGSENMPLEFAAAGVLTGVTASVSKVDFDTKTIRVVASGGAPAANDVIFHKGSFSTEMAGIHKIITNTSTLFGIDASQYGLWKGNQYDAQSAELSFAKIQEAIARAVEKGLDNDVMVLVNPKAWADLLTNEAALRRYDSSYSPSQAEQGSKEIKFHGQNGLVEIVPSIYVKEGYSYIVSLDEMMRIGSTDVTFRRPGRGDEFFRDLENNAGYELRCYCDQALFCHAPGKNVLIHSIVNNQ